MFYLDILLPINSPVRMKLQEVIGHCNLRTNAWVLHVAILLLAFLSYHSAIQLSSPSAENELPYFVSLMSEAIAIRLWQLTTTVTLLVFLVSSIFQSCSVVTLWAGGSLVSASIWGLVQYYLLIGRASYQGVMSGNPDITLHAFYFLPVFGVFWIFLMLVLAHMGLIVFRKTKGKRFLQSWHELPFWIKIVLPLILVTTLILQM